MIISPVTHSNNTTLIEKIPCSEIIRLYKERIDMDISRYFTGLETIDIYQCNDSKYRFYYPENIFGDAAFYEELQKMSFYYNTIHWEHLTAEKFISPNDYVLELGCGLGYFIDRLKGKGIKTKGLELNPKAAQVCREKGLDVADELIEEHAAKNPEAYDVVCSFQVLEHIYDIKGFIDGSCKALRKGGKMICAVPHNNPYYLKYDKMNALNMPPHHAGLWNRESFGNLTKFFPLKTIDIRVEPLYNRNLYVESYLKNHSHTKMLNLYKKIHPGITNRLLLPMRWFVPGKIIIAIYEKQ